MERFKNIRNWLPYSVSLLFILLFVYAAVSKLVDYENFRVQLGQSPMLTAFAGTLSWFVPTLELLIAFFLFIPRFRLKALYACFFLMTAFSFYIVAILNFSPYVPCSCGGILDSMGWTSHLIFNIGFAILALVAIFIQNSNGNIKKGKTKITWKLALGCILAAALLVLTGLAFSERMIQSPNNFLRIFPPHPIEELVSIPLKYNSYYLAGIHEGKVYLGNATAPLHMVSIDPTSAKIREFSLLIKDEEQYNLTSAHVKVRDSMVYLYDGTVPILFRGRLSTGKLSPYISGIAYFDKLEPLSHESFAIRSFILDTGENTLGLLNNNETVQFFPKILQKQVDGIFSTDGTLHYNEELQQLIYTYYYRNQYLLIDSTMNVALRGQTIDTNSVAKVSAQKLDKINSHQMTSPPMTVNRNVDSYRNRLFVHSALLAKNEDRKEFSNSSVIDVYNLKNQDYAFSLYIPDYQGNKLREFRVTKDKVFGLFARSLVIYELGQGYFKD